MHPTAPTRRSLSSPGGLVALVALVGCGPRGEDAPQTTRLFPTEAVAGSAHSAGAVVYVPVWSSIYVADGDQTFELTVTLTVRNADLRAPITITSLRYYDKAGALLHEYVEQPTQIGPLASADTVVRKSDTRAGVGGSFIVEWRATDGVHEPVIQAIMVGTDFQQGISFLSEGRVLSRTPAPAAP